MKILHKLQKEKIVLAIITLLIGIMVLDFFAFVQFDVSLYKKILEHQTPQVAQLAQYVENTFQTELNRCIQALKIDAVQIESAEDIFSEEVMSVLKETQVVSGFCAMGVIDLEGNCIDINGISQENLRERFIKSVHSGEIYVSNAMDTESDEVKILFAVPLQLQGKKRGAVWGKYALKDMIKMVTIADDAGSYFQVVDDRGHYISSSQKGQLLGQSKTIWEDLESYTFKGEVTVESIRTALKDGQRGSFFFLSEGLGNHVNYQPLGVNNWYIFSVQTEEALHQYSNEIQRISMLFFSVVVIGLVAFAGLIIGVVYNIYKVIDQKHSQMEALNGMFELILQKTRDIPFEVDVAKQKITIYGHPTKTGKKTYWMDQLQPEYLLKRKQIAEESLSECIRLHNSIKENKECEPAVIYVQEGPKQGWVRITIVAGVDKGTRIIGVLEDYNEYMQKQAEIEQYLDNIKKIQRKSQIDFLTGLYNREALIKEIDKALTVDVCERGLDAFFILDLDQFKQINDVFGHSMGDTVLKETAHILLGHIRKEDIVGRLGGDEFVLFLRNMDKVESIVRKAREINEALCCNYKKGDETLHSSASIGVAIARDKTETFYSLYEKADKALYKVKEETRNGYQVFDE